MNSPAATTHRGTLIGSIVLSAVLTAGLSAQDWPNWRGPNYDGSADARQLPADFGPDKHVRWSADLPGPAAGTPIIIGDRIFTSSTDPKRERLMAVCLDRKDGSVRWKRDAGSGYRPGGSGSRLSGGRRSNYASPSPATDGERVVFFFGNGDLVAYDLDGEELWRRNIQEDYGDFAFQWTFSASPTMWDGKLYLPVLQRDVAVQRRRRGGPAPDDDAEPAPLESFLLALEPATGETVFKVTRPSPARVESRESYGTLIPYVSKDGRKELLLAGGDVITGHDPANGEELWRWGTWNPGHREQWWRLVPTVVVGDGVGLVCAPKGQPVFAVRLDGEGELDQDALAWKSGGRRNPISSDVPSPAFHDGHFFVLSDVRSALSKVNAGTGEVVWTTALSKDYKWRASPTVADGKVWCMNHNAEVTVLDAADGAILHSVRMGGEDDDGTRSSIIVAHGCLFIRTNAKMYCIGS